MKLLIIIGDSAVGKMTVGQELMKITDLRLFHNHMVIEPVMEVFGFFKRDTNNRLREIILEDFAASENYGMILTGMWAFDMLDITNYTPHEAEVFKKHGAEVYYAELVAPQEVRLQRNATENRLQHKASKRDIERSDWLLRRADEEHRFVSYEGEVPFENYIRIDNTDVPPEIAAQMIKERFRL